MQVREEMHKNRSLVEDNRVLRRQLRTAMERVPYHAPHFSSTVEARAAVKGYKAVQETKTWSTLYRFCDLQEEELDRL